METLEYGANRQVAISKSQRKALNRVTGYGELECEVEPANHGSIFVKVGGKFSSTLYAITPRGKVHTL